MNIVGAIAVVCSVLAFSLTYRRLGEVSAAARWKVLGVFSLLAIPSMLFAVYYVHILPEQSWFYTLRSWRGTEFLVVFLGCATGAAASLLPRLLLGVPLFVLIALATVPHVKPLIKPISDDQLRDHWDGEACLQSSASTCGPASVCTILKHLGFASSERTIARAAYSYGGGTEAWYLARHVRSRGCKLRFDFRKTYAPEAGLPAMVGVKIGGAGHFIAVLDITEGHVTFADPLQGKESLSLAEFHRRYEFTGFHMIITAAH